jgi:hypothetical protein
LNLVKGRNIDTVELLARSALVRVDIGYLRSLVASELAASPPRRVSWKGWRRRRSRRTAPIAVVARQPLQPRRSQPGLRGAVADEGDLVPAGAQCRRETDRREQEPGALEAAEQCSHHVLRAARAADLDRLESRPIERWTSRTRLDLRTILCGEMPAEGRSGGPTRATRSDTQRRDQRLAAIGARRGESGRALISLSGRDRRGPARRRAGGRRKDGDKAEPASG